MEIPSANFTTVPVESHQLDGLSSNIGDQTPASSPGNSLDRSSAVKTLEVRPKLEHYKYCSLIASWPNTNLCFELIKRFFITRYAN